ncbi:lamin tail domain-containing protein [Leifsonia sp. F6_8S_P_1B]|uniref:Lamin tail domain-containing protein n=1 Tax=Leifsonia williamsii TaxID=3035919 RepID=A0ABT8K9K6_9MICO|nr:lamin tail domain-containing protein [Leifsonia williamsii]MDN4614145.1 lamin tail domain-containing protein [Leifsonia williamsii]
MRLHLTRAAGAIAAAATAGALAIAVPTAAQAAATPDVRITEWMYNPVNSSGEFFELTNLGTAPVSLAGWSFDDDSRLPGTVPLDSLGTLAVGESAIVTESADATFRAEWGLSGGVKFLAGNTVGLGRADEINIFDGTDAVANLVDRLTYNDQATDTTKGPRTQGVSGIPKTAAALGANDASQWQLSAVGDTESSRLSVPGAGGSDIGSPGTSRFAPAGGTPDWSSVRINEVSSDNGATPVGDAVELYNSGDAAVSIDGWLQIDSGAASAATAFAAKLPDGTATTSIPAHGYVYFSSTKGLGSGGDSVKVYLPDGANGAAGTLVDSVDYTAGEAGTDETNGFGAGAYARCEDGTGAFVSVKDKSFGASNADACKTVLTNPADGGNGPTLNCEPEAPSGTGTLPSGALTPAVWPGSADVTVADQQCAWKTTTGPEGRDVSGLVFDPKDPNVLYSVKNKSWVYRMVKQGGLWVADTANGWGAGKQIFFPGSTDTATNQPDSEGLTIGADGALYVTTERNNAANTIPLNSILRFDPTSSATQLVATDQWDLTAEFPELHPGNKTEANLGFEGVTFVPDSYLTKYGFVDQSTGKTYKPADYPLHGTGLYFAALENDGKLYAYALNSDHSFKRVAVVDTGMGHVMDVQYNADTQRIWALCDNTCGVVSTLLKVSTTGAIVPGVAYAKPAGLPVNNLEGFALAPSSTCVDGTKEAVWSDDGIYGVGAGSATEGHALFSGRIDCDLKLGDQGVPAPGGPEDPAATLSLSAGSGTVGTTVTVEGEGFAAGSRVSFVFNSTPVELGATTAADDGSLRFAFAVPQVPAGAHTVTASVNGTVVASAAFTVTAAAAGPAPAGDGSSTGNGASAVVDPALASTGSDLGIAGIAAAVTLLLAGGALLVIRRRRKGDAVSE